ncbi:hypothetical protein THASP1DRAFT_26060 [Thamnocephalis sphaerospora]|uniref:Uncharacterized protein n=1 Tax=Thamnocephalis sphaerospora TaxID=78915 RepID=A0A4P9XID1_9FUNG|nr:hypothetical protein THASP1DRAFT_26060 [Thamnocephalis sphaerospora]|eukprot:RKP05446.1 hypothetical protein THASP1DRAFT_26060 [Thamnocephalis sphaerospora]
MRFISRSGVTATVALVGLTFVGSLASAASMLPRGHIATAEDLATLKSYLGDYLQFQPQPGLAKPKGSVVTSFRDGTGHIGAIEIRTPSKVMLRELTVMTVTKVGKPRYIEMVDSKDGKQVPELSNAITLGYDEQGDKVMSYKLVTQNGYVTASVEKNADGTNDLNVMLWPADEEFKLKNVPLWDGKEPFFPGDKA